MLTQPQKLSAESVISGLRGALWTARANLATTWGYATAGVEVALDDISQRIDKLAGVQLQAVDSGSWSFEKWLGLAQDYSSALAQYSSTLDADGAIAIARDTLTQTAKDTVAAVKTAVPEGIALTKWIVVGMVALAVIYVARVFR